jgi:hypothetical protein
MLTGDPVTYSDLLAWTHSFGYSFEVLPAPDWLSSVAKDPRNPAHLVAHTVLNVSGSRAADRSIDTLATYQASHGEDFRTLPAPTMSEDMFHRILHRMTQDMLLPVPADR